MCRMFALVGDFRDDFDEIFSALKDVARNDPLYKKSRDTVASHPDGWGYVNFDGKSIQHGRFVDPVYDYEAPAMKNGYIIVHARNAALNEPFGPTNSHPSHKSDERYETFLAHNGWFDKAKMVPALDNRDMKNETDSEVFQEFLMIQKGTLRERMETAVSLSKSLDFVKSGVNLLFLGIERSTRKGELYYHSDGKIYEEYHVLHLIEGEEWKGIFSSSISLSKHFPEYRKKSVVERGCVFELI